SMDSEKRAHFGGTGLKTQNAADHGAVGVILLGTEASEKRYSWDRVKHFATSTSMTWVGPDGEPDVPAKSMNIGGFMSNEGAAKLFEGAKFSYEQLRKIEADENKKLTAFELPVTVSMAGGATFKDVASPNVIGMIEGADPALKAETVVLSAHLDAVGMDEPKDDDKNADLIKNGALDNAIGVATMIEAARAFKESGVVPPRTIVFLAVTGEEKGLLGADYFAHFPTVAKEDIVADVNLDMPLVLYDFVDVVAFGAERSTLGEMVGEAANSMGLALSPDPMPEQGLFTRSDHYRFVEQGVPSVFLVVGFGNGGDKVFADFLATNYHKPGDDISQPINYDAAAKFADLNYRIAKAVADSPERPRWKEGDFFGDLFGK
ncbi:MAG: M20/M25/M40 family metallo-hydrolase, partial [Amphiplicatus sp.]